MNFFAFFASGLCLISATGVAELSSDANGGHDIFDVKGRQDIFDVKGRQDIYDVEGRQNIFDPNDGHDTFDPDGDHDVFDANGEVPQVSSRRSSSLCDCTAFGEPPLFTEELLTLPEPSLAHCDFRHQRQTFTITDGEYERMYMVSNQYPSYLHFNETLGMLFNRGYSWLDARKECRKWCMELVSIDSYHKFMTIAQKMRLYKIPSIWTSGRLCDFKGCPKTNDVEGLFKRGWFWAEGNYTLPHTDVVPLGYGFNHWSDYGTLNINQPDQAEVYTTGKRESCIAFMDNYYKDNIRLHDLACHHEKQFICEESIHLLKYMEQKYNVHLNSDGNKLS